MPFNGYRIISDPIQYELTSATAETGPKTRPSAPLPTRWFIPANAVSRAIPERKWLSKREYFDLVATESPQPTSIALKLLDDVFDENVVNLEIPADMQEWQSVSLTAPVVGQ